MFRGGGGCRSVQGTELLTNAANVTASGRAIKRADRAQIIGVSDTTQTACTAFFESETVVGFACEQAVASSTGPALAPYTVHGKNASTHEALVFTRHPFEMNSHLRAIPTDAENSAAAARGAQLRSLAVRAFQNAGGPMTAKRFKAALRGDEEQSRWTRLEPARLIKTLYSPDDLYGGLQFDYFPDYREFDDPDGHSLGSGWSDTFDFYFTDYNSEIWDFLTRAECIAACDSNLGGQNDFCDSWSTVVFDLGAVATVGATYVGFARGPRFAGTIFLAGLATSGSIAGLAASNCKVYYINERYQCRQRC